MFVIMKVYTNNESGTNKSQAEISTQIKNYTQKTTFSQKEHHIQQENIGNENCTKVNDVPIPRTSKC